MGKNVFLFWASVSPFGLSYHWVVDPKTTKGSFQNSFTIA